MKQGLVNIGNTCYMNSILQCLAATDNFVHKILSQTAPKDNILYIIKKIFIKIMKSSQPVIPNKLLQKVNLTGQQDCHEFLIKLFCLIEIENDSLINDVFGMELIITIECQKCNNKIIKNEKTNFIILPIQNTIDECFAAYIENSVTYTCDKCKNSTHKSCIKFNSYPDKLIIVLSRSQLHSKNNTNISTESICIDGNIYDLYAFVNHYGSKNSGHYIAVVEEYDRIWSLYNDEHVSELDTSEIDPGKAYILFYEKRC